MLPKYNYDTAAGDSISDCETYCKQLPCDLALLGNGECDLSCNSFECGFDHGDCEPCSLDCIFLNYCSPECSPESCRFIFNPCECSDDCAVLAGNGICEEECKHFYCNYDGGDCEACSPELLMNGVCDTVCDYAEVGFDNQACVRLNSGCLHQRLLH